MNIDWVRSSLIVGMIVVGFLLVQRWSAFQDQKIEMQEQQSGSEEIVRVVGDQEVPAAKKPSNENELPTPESQMTSSEEDIKPIEASQSSNTESLIEIKTDTQNVVIDPVGGDIIQLSLVQIHQKLNRPDLPFPILRSTNSHLYTANSYIIGLETVSERLHYSSKSNSYQMNDGNLIVDLHTQKNDIQIIKRFTFKPDSYLIDIEYIINNKSNENKKVYFSGRIRRDSSNPNHSVGIGMAPFLGAATSMNDQNYEKFDFDDIADKKIQHSKVGGWLAMVQHYFLSAWIPDQNVENDFIFSKPGNDLYNLTFISPTQTVKANDSLTLKSQFYSGPKNVRKLEKIAPFLDLTVDYGWLWWIAKPLFMCLQFIQGFVVNWGIAIIILTLMIKLIFFYPSAMSYRSMAKMRKVQPKMQEIKERCGDDRQKLSQEMMKLYRTEKINPVSGCLPILIQMPVFIALYWTLMESVELRHAPFFLWIEDLSVKDPYFVLPIIMGATMWIQQKLNPQNPDPTMAKMMQIMPIFFTVLFLFFPAGLVLYWVVNNSLSIAQQYVITKQIERS